MVIVRADRDFAMIGYIGKNGDYYVMNEKTGNRIKKLEKSLCRSCRLPGKAGQKK